MVCTCLEAEDILNRLRKGDVLSNYELASMCVVSIGEELRNKVTHDDIDLVKAMLKSDNPHLACIGQVLIRPFLYSEGMKEFLIDLWMTTEHEYLKAGLLFDLFEYDDLDSIVVKACLDYLEKNYDTIISMLKEWLECIDNTDLNKVISKKIKNNEYPEHKRILYKKILDYLN